MCDARVLDSLQLLEVGQACARHSPVDTSRVTDRVVMIATARQQQAAWCAQVSTDVRCSAPSS